jgi:hypothetical protein
VLLAVAGTATAAGWGSVAEMGPAGCHVCCVLAGALLSGCGWLERVIVDQLVMSECL